MTERGRIEQAAKTLAKLSDAEWLQVKCDEDRRRSGDVAAEQRMRSRFLGRRYPRPGVAPCGRPSCPVCAPCEQLGFIADAIERGHDGTKP